MPWDKMWIVSYIQKIIQSTDPYHFSENHRLTEWFELGYQPWKRLQSRGNSVQSQKVAGLGAQWHSSFFSPIGVRALWFPVLKSSEYTNSKRCPCAHMCACTHRHTKNMWYTHSWLQRSKQRAVALLAWTSPWTLLKSCHTDMGTANNHILFCW